MLRTRPLMLALAVASIPSFAAEETPISPAVEQLRHAEGKWDATTEFIAPDGSVARSVEGTYEFEWVVKDRVLIGRSEQPELSQASGLLFFYSESTDATIMASVGADGHLWVMTGPADSEERTTPPTEQPDGSMIQLRFTRYNVELDSFESKMEISSDGGETWRKGNHQIFRRQGGHATAATAAKTAPPSAAAAFTWENLAARLDAEAKAGFTGAVLVVRDGEVVLDKGYGLANRELGLAVTPDTIFATGSLPIDYTHAALLKLAQDGKLEFSDPISKFFTDVPEDKSEITIRQLMTGGSGLPDFHGVPSDPDPDHHWIDRDEAMRRIFAQRLLFPPGQNRQHSHSAWGVLAAIVEIASGKSYQDFTREHIFGPAGMNDTGFNGDPVPEERLAIGYGMRSDGEINAPPYWGKTSWLVLGSGGQIGTARDTGRFFDAMREGKILEPEWAERFFGDGAGASRNGDIFGYEMFVYRAPMATSYAVTLTNANQPEPGSPDETHFVRVSEEIGELLLAPYRPKHRIGLGFEADAEGTVVAGTVVPGGASDRGGLRTGDKLLSVAGTPLGDDPIAVLLPYLQSGNPIVFLVRRNGEELEITVEPEPR